MAVAVSSRETKPLKALEPKSRLTIRYSGSLSSRENEIVEKLDRIRKTRGLQSDGEIG